MGAGGVGQGEGTVDADGERALLDPGEEVRGALQQLGAIGDVVRVGGTRQVQRAFGVQHLGIERRHGAAGLAEEHQIAARAQAVEALLEGGLAHGVVDDVHAAAARQAARLGGEIGLGVADHLVGAGSTGHLGLLVAGDSGDHPRALLLGNLHQQRADPTSGGVDQRGLAGPQRIRAAGQIVRRHPLQHDGGGRARVDGRGQQHQQRGGRHGVLGICAGDGRRGHAVAGPQIGHGGADGIHHAGALTTGRPRQ